jgi:hypothetical protein
VFDDGDDAAGFPRMRYRMLSNQKTMTDHAVVVLGLNGHQSTLNGDELRRQTVADWLPELQTMIRCN